MLPPPGTDDKELHTIGRERVKTVFVPWPNNIFNMLNINGLLLNVGVWSKAKIQMSFPAKKIRVL